MTVRTTDGAQVDVSTAAPATFDDVGYEALTWAEVGQVVSVGGIGKTFNDVTSYDLKSGEIIHIKGSSDWQETPITIDNEETDAGQVILKAHHDGASTYSPVFLKVTHQDGSGLIEYYGALVYSFDSDQLAQDTVYRSTISMRIKTGTYVKDLT